MGQGNSSRRRPVWDSAGRLHIAEFLKSAVKKITLARVSVFLLALVAGFYLYRELTRNVLIIEPFSVPRQYADLGLTGEVIANHVSDALEEIEKQTIAKQRQVGLRFDKFMPSGDLPSTIDVEIPGTKLGLRMLVDISREVFGIHPKRVRGDVVLTGAPVSISVRVSGTRHADVTRLLTGPVNDPQQVAHLAAEAILRDMNPFLLGVYKYEQCELQSVEEIGREMVTDPDHLEAALGHDLLGLVLGNRQHQKAAAAQFQQATDLAPQLTFAYSNWGLALDLLGERDATDKYKEAAKRDPSFSRVHAFWGITLYKQKNTNDGDAQFEQAKKLDSQDPLVFVNWGIALEEQGNHREAEDKYKKATEMDPTLMEAYKDWGDALASQQKWEEAAEKYTTAIEIKSGCAADAYNSWGAMLYYQGKLDDAIAKFRQAVQVDPRNVDAYNSWGNMLVRQDKTDEAIAKFQKALQIDPMSVDAYNNWGRALQQHGRFAEAKGKFDKANALSSPP